MAQKKSTTKANISGALSRKSAHRRSSTKRKALLDTRSDVRSALPKMLFDWADCMATWNWRPVWEAPSAGLADGTWLGLS